MFFASAYGWRQEVAVCQFSLHSARCAGASPKIRILGKSFFFSPARRQSACDTAEVFWKSKSFWSVFLALVSLLLLLTTPQTFSIENAGKGNTEYTHLFSRYRAGWPSSALEETKTELKGEWLLGRCTENGALLLYLMCKSAAVCNLRSTLQFLQTVLTGLTVV